MRFLSKRILGRLVKRFGLWSSNFGEGLLKQWFNINECYWKAEAIL